MKQLLNEKYVFYTYNHYNDFCEYLNYYGGWGETFGNITGGGTISSKTDYNPTAYVPVVIGHLPKTQVQTALDACKASAGGFEEGVVAVDVVLAAHAAWRQAKAEALDAHIALRLGSLHLQKVMGEELDDR